MAGAERCPESSQARAWARVFSKLRPLAMSQLAVLCSGAVLAMGFRKLLDLRQPKAVKPEEVETKLG